MVVAIYTKYSQILGRLSMNFSEIVANMFSFHQRSFLIENVIKTLKLCQNVCRYF